MSFTNTKRFYKNPEIIKRFDFIEVFNACESMESNEKAAKLAYKYQKVGIGGSDAHRPNCVSMAYTDLPERVTCETELISLIRKRCLWKSAECYIIRRRRKSLERQIRFWCIRFGSITKQVD